MINYKVVYPQTQIIFFKDGSKRTIANVVGIVENEMTKLLTLKGEVYLVNKSNVNCVCVNSDKEPEGYDAVMKYLKKEHGLKSK